MQKRNATELSRINERPSEEIYEGNAREKNITPDNIQADPSTLTEVY